jgi:hypothetical protein
MDPLLGNPHKLIQDFMINEKNQIIKSRIGRVKVDHDLCSLIFSVRPVTIRI